jgi:biopolymer transport protein ExbD
MCVVSRENEAMMARGPRGEKRPAAADDDRRTVTVAVDLHGTITVDGEPVTIEELPARLTKLPPKKVD